MNTPIQPPRCDPHDYHVVRKRQANGDIRAGRQCTRCGHNGGGVPQDGLDMDSLPWWDAGLVASWQGVLDAHSRARRRDEWWAEYNAYLQSDKWKVIRRKVLERCRRVCEGCMAAWATQIHHTTYAHLGDEFLFELLGLCDACHARWHGKKPRPKSD